MKTKSMSADMTGIFSQAAIKIYKELDGAGGKSGIPVFRYYTCDLARCLRSSALYRYLC